MRKWIVSVVMLLAMGGFSGEVMAQQVKTKPRTTKTASAQQTAARKRAAARKQSTASQRARVRPQQASSTEGKVSDASASPTATPAPNQVTGVKPRPSEAQRTKTRK